VIAADFATIALVIRNRNRRIIIASVGTVMWLAYMWPGLALIDQFAPTVRGAGPAGLAAFVGLIWGVVTTGLIMWAASD
jgi:membrane-associated HD superfamily phosphohydrolase